MKVIYKAAIQSASTPEGARDPLTPAITKALLTQEVVDKNNYKTYSSMVKGSYEMYNNRTDYGSEMFGSVVETRVVFIGGEGISAIAEKKSTQKYIDKFLRYNKLHGSLLIDLIRTGELEGKDLIVMFPKTKKILNTDIRFIKVQNMQWWTNPYSIEVNPTDTDEIKKVVIKPKKEEDEEKSLPIDKLVYVKLGGSDDRINETVNRNHRILTDVENFSRAKYDLRKNNHLFAKIMPSWKTATIQEAKAINTDVNNGDWQPGKGYAGTGIFSLIGPPLGALQAITGEMLLNLKIISSNSGIPVHWLAWPELMSNRATAENLLEVVNAATKKERLIWEEKLRELINKSMIMAIDAGYEKNEIIGEYHIELPLISLANLKALQETWVPLQLMGAISMGKLQSKIPSINPSEEQKLIEKEKKASMERFEEAGAKPDSNDLRSDKTKNLNEDKKEDDTGKIAE